MKKILQAILCMLVIGGLIFGATSGSITLTGTVSAQVSIEIVEVNLPLDLDTSATDLKVATVTERSNTGYTIELTSVNGGKLIGAAFSEELTYTATYDDVSVLLKAVAQEIVSAGTRTGGTGVAKDFDISYTIVPFELAVDTYTDTLTLTIIAN